MDVKVTHSAFIERGQAEVDELESIVSWDVQPPFVFGKPGRTCWVETNQMITARVGRAAQELRSVYIKGVGLFDHRGLVRKPSLNPYHRIHSHLGFAQDGRFLKLDSQVSPEGAMTHRRAVSEFQNAATLQQAGCSCHIPVRVYRYDDTCFTINERESDSLGVVIVGLPDSSFLRCDELFARNYSSATAERQIQTWRYHFGTECKHGILTHVLKGFGRELGNFHRAGLYRYSGHVDNYTFSVNRKTAVLLDLDSCRLLSECTEIQSSLYVARDIASALYGLFVACTRATSIERFPPDIVIGSGFIKSLLGGYFCNTEEFEDAVGLIAIAYVDLYNRAISIYAGDPRVGEVKAEGLQFQEYRRLTREQFWIDRFELYSKLVFFVCGMLRSEGSLDNSISDDWLLQRIKDFVGTDTVTQIKHLARVL